MVDVLRSTQMRGKGFVLEYFRERAELDGQGIESKNSL